MHRVYFCLLVMLVLAIGCSDEYESPISLSGGSDTTIVVNPPGGGPGTPPADSVYIVRTVDLSVSPSDNNDSETVSTGRTKPIYCDAWALVEWGRSSESDMTLNVDRYLLPIPDPMSRTRPLQWVGLGLVRIDSSVDLILTMNKGSVKRDDTGSNKNQTNRVTKVVFTTVGLRE